MSRTGAILIIDDEKGYRDFYKYVLEPLGYAVSAASDGEEGLRMAKQKEYDLIMLDVHMPKMRGPEVLSEIKKIKPEQKIVIFSSSSDPSFSFETNAKKMGAFDCLFKPVDMEEMLRIVSTAIDSSGGKNEPRRG